MDFEDSEAVLKSVKEQSEDNEYLEPVEVAKNLLDMASVLEGQLVAGMKEQAVDGIYTATVEEGWQQLYAYNVMAQSYILLDIAKQLDTLNHNIGCMQLDHKGGKKILLVDKD